MSALKTPHAEFDAQRVASIWKKHGRDKATIAYRQIVLQKSLVNFEALVLSNRIHEIYETEETEK